MNERVVSAVRDWTDLGLILAGLWYLGEQLHWTVGLAGFLAYVTLVILDDSRRPYYDDEDDVQEYDNDTFYPPNSPFKQDKDEEKDK